MPAMRVLLGGVVALAIACGGGQTTGPAHNTSSGGTGDQAGGAAATTGGGAVQPAVSVGVALQVTPAEATVVIDDMVLGRAAQLAPVIALAPGLHTLEIKQEGFKAYRAEFSVTDKVEAFVVKLEPLR
jgi:hypothetical protein